MGRTAATARAGVIPAFALSDRADAPVTPDTALDGAVDETGRVLGTYIHGLLHNAGVRRALLRELARRKGVALPDGGADIARDREYDRLADWVRHSLRMGAGVRNDRPGPGAVEATITATDADAV